MCAHACVWLEKPEPLLESGHDLAVTHGNSEREGESATAAEAQTLKNKLELDSPRRERERERERGLMGVCCSSAQLPPGASVAAY